MLKTDSGQKLHTLHYISLHKENTLKMAHPQVEDGGDSLHIWRIGAYILNKQSQTADSLGVE
jgi:hypothetical protein